MSKSNIKLGKIFNKSGTRDLPLKYVYFLTTCELRTISDYGNKKYVEYLRNGKEDRIYDLRKSTLGWYPTFEQAEECVLTNNCDIHECSCTWAVIEKLHFGIYPYLYDSCFLEHKKNDFQTFYQWVGPTNTFEDQSGGYKKLEDPPKELIEYYKKDSMIFQFARMG